MRNNETISKEDHIYNEIKSAIINRKIGPRTHLSEKQLAEVFNVSRTPVRQVLQRLQFEKFVEIMPNRGAFIYEPTLKEIEEIFQLRGLLEVEAVRLACQKATKEQLENLEMLTHKEDALYREDDYGKVLPIINEIHLGIVRLSGVELLSRFCKELIDLTSIYLAFYDNPSKDPKGPEEHRQIIRLIRQKREKEAQEVLLFLFSLV